MAIGKRLLCELQPLSVMMSGRSICQVLESNKKATAAALTRVAGQYIECVLAASVVDFSDAGAGLSGLSIELDTEGILIKFQSVVDTSANCNSTQRYFF